MKRFFLFFLVFYQSAFGIESVDISNPEFNGRGFGKMSYWYLGDDDIDTIASPAFHKNFTQGEKARHSFGMDRPDFWVKIRFHNPLPDDKVIYVYDTLNFVETLKVYHNNEIVDTLVQQDSLRERIIEIGIPANSFKTLFIERTAQGPQRQSWTYWNDEKSLVSEIRDSERNWSVVIAIFVMSLLFNCILYFSYRTRQYLYYICYLLCAGSFCTLVWSIISHPRVNTLVQISSSLSLVYTINFTIEFLDLRKTMPRSQTILKVSAWSAFLILMVMLINPQLANSIFIMVTGFSSLATFVIATVLYMGRKEIHILFFIVGFGTLLLGNLIQMIIWKGHLSALSHYNHISFYAAALENILMLVAMGYKITQTHDELKKHTGKVEILVDEKTRHISSVMTHIKQGIFTVLPDRSIEKNYSNYLEEIFDKKGLAGNPVDFLLKGSSLSEDDLDRIESCLLTSLGEFTKFNFDMNRHHLPSNIIYNEKDIELDWQSITDDEGYTEKIMVVARDITRLKDLEERSQAYKEEMVRIEEIIAVPIGTCQNFFVECRKFLDENQRLINANTTLNASALGVIFINYHTMKGNGRALNFKYLVDTLHTAESYCSHLRHDPSAQDASKIKSDLEAVNDSLLKYTQLNEGKLGRSATDDKSFKLTTVESTIEMFNKLPVALKKEYEHLKGIFHDAYFKSSEEIFSNIFSHVRTLSKDLGKDHPRIEISGPAVNFSPGGAALLNNIFIHLVRNSLDHGIEKPDERIQKGKDPTGGLYLRLNQKGKKLLIHFRDDGAGLDLKGLKEIGIAKNLIVPDEGDPVKIADLIFQSGISTAEAVTEISGRGVGMDAVRTYAEKAGGSLAIELSDKFIAIDQSVGIEFILTLDAGMFGKVESEAA